MTLNQAIQELTEARDQIGGDAPLLMADYLHVVKFNVDDDDGAVFVCDVREDGSTVRRGREEEANYDPAGTT
jgi:hypothetical protein